MESLRRGARARPWLPILVPVLGACGGGEMPGEARGVLVIAVDALRADHVSGQGYDRQTTPSLDELARQGVTFREAFTSAPQIVAAHVALMTGCEPLLALRTSTGDGEEAVQRRWRIPYLAPHLAVELLAAGYATAAFVDDPRLSEVHGFGPGFQRYEVLEQETAERWEGDQTKRVVDRFLQWLRGLDGQRSWFAYLHLHELDRFWSERGRPWDDYFQPRPELEDVPPVGNTDAVFFAIPRSRWRGSARTLGQYEASYDGEVRLVDQELGRLLASLRRLERFDSASIHVVGTYGIQFGEAGLYLQAGRYSPADLHVPWVFHPRQGQEAARGKGVDGVVSLLDLAPTILALEGLAPPASMRGLSRGLEIRDPGAPAREPGIVFSSCGLQEGCVAIGERHCLEVLVPQGVFDPQLRRSWFGDWMELEPAPQQVFYDRRATPYPELSAAPAPLGEAEAAPYRASLRDWLRALDDARASLQAPRSEVEGDGLPGTWR